MRGARRGPSGRREAGLREFTRLSIKEIPKRGSWTVVEAAARDSLWGQKLLEKARNETGACAPEQSPEMVEERASEQRRGLRASLRSGEAGLPSGGAPPSLNTSPWEVFYNQTWKNKALP